MKVRQHNTFVAEDKMDNLSYYGTLAAILLIQISFAWLYRQQDGYSRSLSRDQITDNRLAIILVNYNNQFGRALKERLEVFGFSIYAIRFSEDQAGEIYPSVAHGSDSKVYDLDLQNTNLAEIQRVVEQIDQDLSANRRKLHAFIDFRPSCSRGSTGETMYLPPSEVVLRLDRLKELVFRQMSLTVLFSQRIKDDRVKMIVVRDKSNDQSASPDPYSSSMAQSINSMVDRYSRNVDKPLVVQQLSTLLHDYLTLIDNNCLSIDLTSEEIGEPEKSLVAQQKSIVDRIVSAILRL